MWNRPAIVGFYAHWERTAALLLAPKKPDQAIVLTKNAELVSFSTSFAPFSLVFSGCNLLHWASRIGRLVCNTLNRNVIKPSENERKPAIAGMTFPAILTCMWQRGGGARDGSRGARRCGSVTAGDAHGSAAVELPAAAAVAPPPAVSVRARPRASPPHPHRHQRHGCGRPHRGRAAAAANRRNDHARCCRHRRRRHCRR